MAQRTRPLALAANVFAGGFSIGVERRFDVAAHLEESEYGVPTVRRNRPDRPVCVGTERWSPFVRDLLKGRRVDFLYGNPPCAAWSQAGKVVFGADWRKDPRVDCTRRHFGLLEEHAPTVWATESVVRSFTAGRELWDELSERAARLGYATTFILHDAKYLGVPQTRRRFFCVFHRVKLLVPALDFENVPTCGDALRKINDPGPQYQGQTDKHLKMTKLFPELTPGMSARDLWESKNPKKKWKRGPQGQVIGRPSFADYYRIDGAKPSHTVAGYSLVHPWDDRCLTIRELAALCSFPPDYEFVGSGQASLIARGVCPAVGAWLADIVADSLAAAEVAPVATTLADLLKAPGRVAEIAPGQAAPPPRAKQAKRAAAEAKQQLVLPLPRPPSYPRPKEGLRSGAYIKLMLSMERYTTAEIVEAVRRHYPKSKATAADVSCGRTDMKKAGHPARVVRVYADGARRVLPLKERADA